MPRTKLAGKKKEQQVKQEPINETPKRDRARDPLARPRLIELTGFQERFTDDLIKKIEKERGHFDYGNAVAGDGPYSNLPWSKWFKLEGYERLPELKERAKEIDIEIDALLQEIENIEKPSEDDKKPLNEDIRKAIREGRLDQISTPEAAEIIQRPIIEEVEKRKRRVAHLENVLDILQDEIDELEIKQCQETYKKLTAIRDELWSDIEAACEEFYNRFHVKVKPVIGIDTVIGTIDNAIGVIGSRKQNLRHARDYRRGIRKLNRGRKLPTKRPEEPNFRDTVIKEILQPVPTNISAPKK